MALCVREGGSGAISTSPWCVETSRRLELVEDDPFESSEGFCVIDVLALVCLLHLGFCFIRQKARIHLTYHSDCKRTQPTPAWQEGDHQVIGCFFSDCRAFEGPFPTKLSDTLVGDIPIHRNVRRGRLLH